MRHTVGAAVDRPAAHAISALPRVAASLRTAMALIAVVNASEGWRSVILGCMIPGMLPLSGRDQSR